MASEKMMENRPTSNVSQNNGATANSLTLPLAELIAVTVFYLLLTVAIMVGNGLILTSFAVNKRLRTVTNTLVMGLAVSDLLVGVVAIPGWIYVYLDFARGDPVGYQFYITSDIFIGTASILQLASISIERCHAIARPFQHRTLPVCFIYALLLVPWLYAAFMASLQHVQDAGNWQDVYTLLMAVTCFLLPVVVITFAYAGVYRYARSRPRKLTRHRSRGKSSFNREVRLSITLAVITCLFVVAWLPLFVMTLIAVYSPATLPPSLATARLLKFVKFCHYSNSALNPFLYTFRNSEMIKTFRYLLYKLACRGKGPMFGLSRLTFETVRTDLVPSPTNKRRDVQGTVSTVVWNSSV